MIPIVNAILQKKFNGKVGQIFKGGVEKKNAPTATKKETFFFVRLLVHFFFNAPLSDVPPKVLACLAFQGCTQNRPFPKVQSRLRDWRFNRLEYTGKVFYCATKGFRPKMTIFRHANCYEFERNTSGFYMEKTAWRTGEKGENQSLKLRQQCQRGFDEEETSDLKGESRRGTKGCIKWKKCSNSRKLVLKLSDLMGQDQNLLLYSRKFSSGI